jgi:hypothetical protein
MHVCTLSVSLNSRHQKSILIKLNLCSRLHHLGHSGKRPESTDTDDGQDNSPPRSPALSDTSDSELSLGTNSPPPTSSQNSQSSPSHPLHAFTSLANLPFGGPTIPIPIASLPLSLPVSSAMTPTPAHMGSLANFQHHHQMGHHPMSHSGIFPTLASLHGFTSAMSMNHVGKGAFFNMPLELHRPFLQKASPDRTTS